MTLDHMPSLARNMATISTMSSPWMPQPRLAILYQMSLLVHISHKMSSLHPLPTVSLLLRQVLYIPHLTPRYQAHLHPASHHPLHRWARNASSHSMRIHLFAYCARLVDHSNTSEILSRCLYHLISLSSVC